MTFKKGHPFYIGGEKSQFQKGRIPWNKGLTYHINLKISRRKYPKKICIICKNEYQSYIKNQKVCSSKCKGTLLSQQRKGIMKISDQQKNNISNTLREKYKNGIIKSTQKGKMYSREQYPTYGMRSKHHSDEAKSKQSNKKIGTIHTTECRQKMRLKSIERIERTKLNGLPLTPCIGNNETKILDYLQNECFNYPIIRQYKIKGYFLDGYCPSLNLAIEIDEQRHKKYIEKDIQRQKEIEEKLNCKFLRIEI